MRKIDFLIFVFRTYLSMNINGDFLIMRANFQIVYILQDYKNYAKLFNLHNKKIFFLYRPYLLVFKKQKFRLISENSNNSAKIV